MKTTTLFVLLVLVVFALGSSAAHAQGISQHEQDEQALNANQASAKELAEIPAEAGKLASDVAEVVVGGAVAATGGLLAAAVAGETLATAGGAALVGAVVGEADKAVDVYREENNDPPDNEDDDDPPNYLRR